MPKLTDEARRYIVQRLACFDTPSEVAEGVKEEFGLVIARQSVREYNPEHGKPAKKWVRIFEETRAAFLAATAKIPIAERSYRLRRLQRMAEGAEQRKNYPLAAQLLEQAAKEAGGLYTNRRELTGKDGEQLIPSQNLDDLSDAQLASIATQLATELGE